VSVNVHVIIHKRPTCHLDVCSQGQDTRSASTRLWAATDQHTKTQACAVTYYKHTDLGIGRILQDDVRACFRAFGCSLGVRNLVRCTLQLQYEFRTFS
jgi:hypothetical protein